MNLIKKYLMFSISLLSFISNNNLMSMYQENDILVTIKDIKEKYPEDNDISFYHYLNSIPLEIKEYIFEYYQQLNDISMSTDRQHYIIKSSKHIVDQEKPWTFHTYKKHYRGNYTISFKSGSNLYKTDGVYSGPLIKVGPNNNTLYIAACDANQYEWKQYNIKKNMQKDSSFFGKLISKVKNKNLEYSLKYIDSLPIVCLHNSRQKFLLCNVSDAQRDTIYQKCNFFLGEVISKKLHLTHLSELHIPQNTVDINSILAQHIYQKLRYIKSTQHPHGEYDILNHVKATFAAHNKLYILMMDGVASTLYHYDTLLQSCIKTQPIFSNEVMSILLENKFSQKHFNIIDYI